MKGYKTRVIAAILDKMYLTKLPRATVMKFESEDSVDGQLFERGDRRREN